MPDLIPRAPLSNTIIPLPDADWRRTFAAWGVSLNRANTHLAYTSAWRDLYQRLGDNAPDVDELSEDDFIRYKAGVQDTYSAATINQRLAAFRSFFRFAQKRGLIDHNPAEGVKYHKVKKYGNVRFLNYEDASALLDAIDTSDLQGLRDYAIILLLLTTGVRRQPVADMRYRDVLQIGSRVQWEYIYKGGTTKRMILPPKTVRAVRVYTEARGDFRPDDYIFQPAHDKRGLTGAAISEIVKKWGKVAGLGDGITAHVLRHTATSIAAQKWSIPDLMTFTGHERPETLGIYIHSLRDSQADISQGLADMF